MTFQKTLTNDDEALRERQCPRYRPASRLSTRRRGLLLTNRQVGGLRSRFCLIWLHKGR